MTCRLWAPSIAAPAIRPGEQRVFGKIFENPAAARVANEIGGAAKQDVETPGPSLRPDRFALPRRSRYVPRRGEGQIRRHGGRFIAAANMSRIRHAKLGVGFLKRRHAEPRNSLDVAGRSYRAARLLASAPRRAQYAPHE